MATAVPNQDSDGKIHAGEPYVDWLRRQGNGPKGVEGTSAEYDCMKPKWCRIQTVLDGTDAMRSAKAKYLPQHEYETDAGYLERLSVSVLDNWTARTLETLVGKAFRDPPQFKDLPAKIEAIEKDADGAGRTMVDMAQAWFREAVAKREAWLFVDFSQGQPRADGQPRTLADDERDGLRPLWKVVCPEDVIFAIGRADKGRHVWTQIRVVENTMEEDGPFGEVLVERIRVHRPGSWELYVKIKDKRTRKWVWKLEDTGLTGLAEIPAVKFCVDGEKPPLEDLVHLNIAHFQSGSDQRSILTTSRFAMLAVSGAPDVDPAAGEKPLVVGPKQWLSTPNPESKFYYVEHSGAAINSGRQDLQDLEQRMASYGAEFLKRQPGRASATGRALDSSEAQSLLQTWVRQFGEHLMQALRHTANWLKMGPTEEVGTVVFDLEADVDAGDPAELSTIDSARSRGDISREAWVDEMKARNIFRSEYDPELDAERLRDELPPGSVVGGFLFQNRMPKDGTDPKDPAGKQPTDPKVDKKPQNGNNPAKE